jgi:hypothetical protein
VSAARHPQHARPQQVNQTERALIMSFDMIFNVLVIAMLVVAFTALVVTDKG